MINEIEKKLRRLTNLLGTDEGFYILALHSFIEYYLREVKYLGNELSFAQLTWEFRNELLDEYGDNFIEGLGSLGQLGKQHQLTNKVRHSFSEIDPEEARAATIMFIRFCRLAGISSDRQLQLFNDHLKLWEQRENKLEQSIIISSLQNELRELKRTNKDLGSTLEGYRGLKAEIEVLRHEIACKTLDISSVKNTAADRNGKIDSLRKDRFTLQQRINSLVGEKESYLKLQTYIDHLGRLTIYTRSRFDYERLIARLSPEQEDLVETIKFDRDYLIRGSAGTGKSLVLISAMQRALSQGRLDFFTENPVLFITFTNTLVKYNKYTAMLMRMKIPPALFTTVDTLIYKRLKNVDTDFVYDFSIAETFLQTISQPVFLTGPELIAELEEYLLGRLIVREEYIDRHIPREGMHLPLNHNQRTAVWMIRDQYIKYMLKFRRYSVNYGRYRLVELMKKSGGPGNGRRLQTIFIDEVQDLNPAALTAVKSLTSGPLIMAGDFQQSLYMTCSPFARAGIDVRGATRILKTNFRNTRQIIEAAEAFRKYRKITGSADEYQVISFREGPPVELFTENNVNDLLNNLAMRISLFTEELGYDPENICILSPSNIFIDELATLLTQKGLPSIRVHTDKFDFTARGRINLSTLHSCKGLDFPVVLLMLPELTRRIQFSDEQTEHLLRNLVYTGMTRAMDHLNIFITQTNDPIIIELHKAVNSLLFN